MPPTSPAVCPSPCGNNAHCEYGAPNQCQCDSGYAGNPFSGCTLSPSTELPHDCSEMKCGLNSICSVLTGRPECICQKGFTGIGYDKCLDIDECQIDTVCGKNAQCINLEGGYDCKCLIGFRGNPYTGCQKETTEDDLCKNQHCGPNAVCSLGQCLCRHGFKGDDAYKGCSAESTCQKTTDCGYNEVCQNNICVDPCQNSICGPNSFCITDNHNMNCICNDGFFGDAKDLTNGCQAEQTCISDADCPSDHVCQININGRRVCLDPCQVINCRSEEKCNLKQVGKLKRPFCECQSGFARDKLDGKCKAAQRCKSNNDCLSHQKCVERDFDIATCVDICLDTFKCPSGSECVAIHHVGNCHCQSGFTGRPDDAKGCFPISNVRRCTSDAQCTETEVCRDVLGIKQCRPVCNYIQCGQGAICIARNHVGKCTCPTGGLFKGNPTRDGCTRVACLQNDDCSFHQFCDNASNTCKNVCSNAKCGDGATCVSENHLHKCRCLPAYIPSPSPDILCQRKSNNGSSICPLGQCQIPCSHNSHCSTGETCNNRGICEIGCTANSDCTHPYLCIDQTCQNPCSVACGPNSQCKLASQGNICICPTGFAGVPTAQQGCVRIPEECISGGCRGRNERCYKNYCMPKCSEHAECARGEQCRNNICVKICHSDKNCLQGEICMDRFCDPGCRLNSDCNAGESCLNGQCTCKTGFQRGASGCEDIDECKKNNPCSAPKRCVNKIGSFECKCPPNLIPGINGACQRPDNCRSDNECSESLACLEDPVAKRRRCMNPCDVSYCTPLASCSVISHKPFCSCPEKHRGDPTDPQIGCYPIECDATKDCSNQQKCDLKSLRCYDACRDLDCGHGSCRADKHEASCFCQEGYEVVKNKCQDIDECSSNNQYCHGTARCANLPGSYRCTCPEGYLGDAYSTRGKGCTPKASCLAHSDCPISSSCTNGQCVDPCVQFCSADATCKVIDHVPTCSCPPGWRGDGRQSGCVKLQCLENIDCSASQSCVNGNCVDVCSLSGACGSNSDCKTLNHIPLCSCQNGFSGDPRIGCSRLLECTRDRECPTNMVCAFGICAGKLTLTLVQLYY